MRCLFFADTFGKERVRNKDLRSHLGIALETSLETGRVVTYCAYPFFSIDELDLSREL